MEAPAACSCCSINVRIWGRMEDVENGTVGSIYNVFNIAVGHDGVGWKTESGLCFVNKGRKSNSVSEIWIGPT